MTHKETDSPGETSFLARLAAAAQRLFSGTQIFLAYAYGSRILGTPRPDSDLDVGYYLSGYTHGARLAIAEEMALAVALSDAVALDVDLRDLGDAPLELRGRVLEDGVRVFSADEVARVNLERDLLGRYHDEKERLERFHEERLRSVAESGL